MQDDEQRIMPRAVLHGAGGEETPCIAPGQPELGETLGNQKGDDAVKDGHGRSSVRKPAVNPGPSVDSSARPCSPSSIAARTTNRTVAADMLPN